MPIILWIFSKLAGGAGGSDLVSGVLIVSLAVLIASAFLLPWRLFFDWSFLYDHWAWFAAVDFLIIGLLCGLWAVRRQRRANLQQKSATSENPF
jgi:peptidoglycan/LPS O-acetylase OafA/YrhL